MAIPVTLVRGDSDSLGASSADVSSRLQELFDAAGADVSFVPVEARDGRVTPDLIAAIRDTGLALMGFQWGRREQGEVPPIVQLRKELGSYANIRPIRSLPGVPSVFDDVDLLVVRETTEDVYAMLEHQSLPGVFESLKVTTRATCERISRFAFETARARGRRKVTTVHKSNIMKKSDGMLLRVSQEIAAEYPDIDHDEVIVDALCMKLVLTPQRFDVLLCGNLYGDIVGDLASGLTGGAVNTPSINLAPGATLFTIGQRGRYESGSEALPMVLASLYLLEHLGQLGPRKRLGDAAERAVLDGIRPDMIGGDADGPAWLTAVLDRLG
ncbi:MAG TPA: isocitrate/isopropylmalate family dehydrogenase [Myxococcota bacterium]|nr:isocitrate/isopropylmalate family dehydrogenase [Myxococcota bacterium]